MLRFISVAVATVWALAVMPAHAGCSRADVEFYLNKGFGNDQIVSLCASSSGGGEPRRSSRSDDRRERSDRGRDISREREEDEIFLRTAIEAYDVEIDDTHVAFTRKQCVEFGWQDWNGFREHACPHVRFKIALKGLRVLSSSKEFFLFGAGTVNVAAKVTHEVLNINEFPAKHHKELLREIASKVKSDAFTIDVRSGMPIYKVEGMLQSLAS